MLDIKLISVVIGALLGGSLSAIGFYFRSKREIKENINNSLFHLLEIWLLLAMVKVTTSEKFHSILIDRIKYNFPHEDIGENETALIKEGMVNALPILTSMEVSNFNGKFIDKYKLSVNELAKIYPLLSFELNRNQMLIKFLGAIDKLTSGASMAENEEAIVINVRNFMLTESLKDLENDLLKLASKSGYLNKKKTKLYTSRIKSNLETIPGEVFDEYITKVIAPVVQQHYDSLGIDNPNLTK